MGKYEELQAFEKLGEASYILELLAANKLYTMNLSILQNFLSKPHKAKMSI